MMQSTSDSVSISLSSWNESKKLMDDVLVQIQTMQQPEHPNSQLDTIYQSLCSINTAIFGDNSNHLFPSMNEKLDKMTSDEFDSIMTELDNNHPHKDKDLVCVFLDCFLFVYFCFWIGFFNFNFWLCLYIVFLYWTQQ